MAIHFRYPYRHPYWIEPNRRKWRRGKRKELNRVLKEMKTLMWGSVYLPGKEFYTALTALKNLKTAMSRKVWD